MLYPAPGGRGYGEGALWSVGYGAYNWSSATSGIDGLDLNFDVTWLSPSYANGRGFGFQLRCLSE